MKTNTRMLAWMGAALVAATTLSAAEPIGMVIALQGRASAAQPQAQSRPLALKSDVFLNDRITTEAGGKLQILFNDDSMISQGEDSTLVVDEYVYSPEKEAGDRFGARMLKGMFRIITGEITKRNPERFKVRGRLATIGIRGCDVGCRVGQTLEHVYILELHRREKVVVGPLDAEGDTWQFEPVTVKHGGRVVSVEANKQTVERDFRSGELALFMGAVTSVPGGTPRKQGKPAGGAPKGGPAPDGGDGGGDGEDDGGGEQTGQRRLPRRLLLRRLALAGQGTGVHNGTSGDRGDPINDPPDLNEPDSGGGRTTTGGGSGGSGNTGGRVFKVRDRGTDWLWGVWEDNDRIVDVEARASNPVDLNTLMDYANSTEQYHLQGDGSAAALVNGDGKTSFIRGDCHIDVWTGGTGTPTWEGSFLLGSGSSPPSAGAAGTSAGLSFQADGSILSNGRMVGSITDYNLYFNGSRYGINSILAQSIYGQLVGNNSLTRPTVTGTAGKWSTDHGSARTKGVWGNNFPVSGSGGSVTP